MIKLLTITSVFLISSVLAQDKIHGDFTKEQPFGLLKQAESMNQINTYIPKQIDHKRKEILKNKINITYDLDKALECRKLQQIIAPQKILFHGVKKTEMCEKVLVVLLDYVDRMKGNLLFISSMPTDCEINKIKSYAYLCE